MVRGMMSLGLVLTVELCAVGSAEAHGTPPEVTQIARRNATDVLVATTRGLVFGDPGAHRWSLLCSEAFGVSIGGAYRVARMQSGRLYISNARGLRVSDDQGCSFRPHPTHGQLDVPFLLQDPTTPERLYLTVFDAERGGIHVSEDGGSTFRALYRADEREFLNSIEVAKGRPTQLYATLLTTEDIPRMFVLRSQDAGVTWSRSELSGAEEFLDVSLLAVNPADPDELLLRVRYIDSRNGDGLLQSRDGGRSFVLLGKYGPVSDVTFTDDGTTSFVVAAGRVMRASTPERVSTPLDAVDGMTFGALFDQQLLLSGYRVVDNRLNVLIWSSEVANASGLQRWMGFDEVTSLATCPAPSSVSELCERDWLDWNNDFLTDPNAAPP